MQFWVLLAQRCLCAVLYRSCKLRNLQLRWQCVLHMFFNWKSSRYHMRVPSKLLLRRKQHLLAVF